MSTDIILQAVSLVVAIFAIYLAWRAFLISKRAERVELFDNILKQISDDETRYYRGLVFRHINSGLSIEDLKKRINDAREASIKILRKQLTGVNLLEGDISPTALEGIAIEKTLVSFDRVAYFLLDGDKLRKDTIPPEWLWVMIDEIWSRLHCWIEYKQTSKDDSEYYQNYVIYFAKLAKLSKKRT